MIFKCFLALFSCYVLQSANFESIGESELTRLLALKMRDFAARDIKLNSEDEQKLFNGQSVISLKFLDEKITEAKDDNEKLRNFTISLMEIETTLSQMLSNQSCEKEKKICLKNYLELIPFIFTQCKKLDLDAQNSTKHTFYIDNLSSEETKKLIMDCLTELTEQYLNPVHKKWFEAENKLRILVKIKEKNNCNTREALLAFIAETDRNFLETMNRNPKLAKSALDYLLPQEERTFKKYAIATVATIGISFFVSWYYSIV